MSAGTFGEQWSTALVIFCDVNSLTLTQGITLAEDIGAALSEAAEDRREVLLEIAPELVDDVPESELEL